MNGRITLNGRYEIIDKIGGGGMAEVFHGYDTVLHRDVGIKILRDQFIQDKQFVARFRQEAAMRPACPIPISSISMTAATNTKSITLSWNTWWAAP